MRRAFESLADENVSKGITANPEVCMNNVLNSATLVTSLNPILGYEKSSAVAKEALKTGKRVYDILLEQKLFTEKELEELLQPKKIWFITMIKSKITVINTGWELFNKVYNPLSGELEVAKDDKSLEEILSFCHNIDFEVLNIISKDSLEMNDFDRELIVKTIENSTNENIIIVHGTIYGFNGIFYR